MHAILQGCALPVVYPAISHTKTHTIDTDMQSTVSCRDDAKGIEPHSINPEWPICTGYLGIAPTDTNMQSTVSVSCRADNANGTEEPESITPEWPICTGYLDTTLAIFKRHKHPFILISTLAMRWSGANNLDQDEIDILVRSSQAGAIVQDLIASGEWKLSTNYADSDNGDDYKAYMINRSQTRDIWLKTCIEDPWFHYLRLWPEELYKLSQSIVEKLKCPMYKTSEQCWLKKNISAILTPALKWIDLRCPGCQTFADGHSDICTND